MRPVETASTARYKFPEFGDVNFCRQRGVSRVQSLENQWLAHEGDAGPLKKGEFGRRNRSNACVERTAGHASVCIATSFACGCSCTRSVSSTQPAASHHSPRVSNCLTVAAQRHGAAAPHRVVMGIKRRPVERPVEHASAAVPRAPRN